MNKYAESEKIRTFIAIPLSSILISELKNVIEHLRVFSKGVNWVKPESIHLTLKFLGNLTKDELSKVFEGMEKIFKTPPPTFHLSASGLGAFPSLRRPRVLWIGIAGNGLENVLNLQKLIEAELNQRGFPPEERAFSPHLTLARIKFADNLSELMQAFTSYQFPEIEFPVENVQVMRSDLRPHGAVYSIQKNFLLSLGQNNER